VLESIGAASGADTRWLYASAPPPQRRNPTGVTFLAVFGEIKAGKQNERRQEFLSP